MTINQFHSGTSVGDAITNQMLNLKNLFINEGYESNIFAEHIHDDLKKDIRHLGQYKGNKNNILIIHHSMGFDSFDDVVGFADKKIFIYHNITPEKFFHDEHTKKYIRKGLHQAKQYLPYIDYAIAASNYNRKELYKFGYRNVDVMPVDIAIDRLLKTASVKAIKKEYEDTTNILFVGRVVPNKCQHDVINAFNYYLKNYNPKSRLILVGDLGFSDYVNSLNTFVKEQNIEGNVIFTGKIKDDSLKSYYEVADVFLCLSEHEGFGVPLLEAMKFSVPVIAYNESAISETMDGAGILLDKKENEIIASTINKLVVDKEYRDQIITEQCRRTKRLESLKTKNIILNAINNLQNNNRKRTIQMQGPFETSYSLAIVNRKLAESLHQLGKDQVSIYCTEGPGDYEPNPSDLKDKKLAKELWEKSSDVCFPDIAIRNMFPPRVNDVKGAMNFQFFGWEENRIPKIYVEDFNKYLSGIGTMSDFVTKSLVDSGLKIPVKTMGVGVSLPNNFTEIRPYKVQTKKSIKFLHISSAFPRKGVDILLKAYFSIFSDKDDVCLIIKTFPNPHNNTIEQWKELKNVHHNPPEVVIYNEDFSETDLYALYKASDCYVHAARGEGFGLPVAEAMLAQIPVIVSPNSGLADFCNENTAVLVDYTMEYANSHLSEDSMWACPNHKTLASCLHDFVYKKDKICIEEKVKNAYELIKDHFSWDAVAKRWDDFINGIEGSQKKPKVAMITSWNCKCGIAEYTRFLVEELMDQVDYHVYSNTSFQLLKKDEDYVKERCWRDASDRNLDRMKDLLINGYYDVVHFQFNFGFYDLSAFGKLINSLYKSTKIIITFHSTKDSLLNNKVISLREILLYLNKTYKLIVHQKDDFDYLAKIGVNKELIQIVPHGQILYQNYESVQVKQKLGLNNHPIIGSYGFLLPHKGIKEIIQAVNLLVKKYPDILFIASCSLFDSAISHEYYKKCSELVEEYKIQRNVILVTDFLDPVESNVLLQACDYLVMPYKPTKESASGAIRFCINAKKPIITTKEPIFDEFKECTYQIEHCTPNHIFRAVDYLLNNQDVCIDLKGKLDCLIKETSWNKISKMHLKIYLDIV